MVHFMLKEWRNNRQSLFTLPDDFRPIVKAIQKLYNLDLVPPKTTCDMKTISYMGLGSSIKGKSLVFGWYGLCEEKEPLGFCEQVENFRDNLDLFYFCSSSVPLYTMEFMGIPLNVV